MPNTDTSDAAFIRARREEVGRDPERERLWERILEMSADSGIPISMVARMLGEKVME